MPDPTTMTSEQLVVRERELFPLVNRAGAAKADVLEYHAVEDELATRDDHDPMAGVFWCGRPDDSVEFEAQQVWP